MDTKQTQNQTFKSPPSVFQPGLQPSRVQPPKARYWISMVEFAAGAVVFWLAEFVYQYYILIPGEWGMSLVRSFGLAGATLISGALFSSVIFKWFPRLARHWRFRRHMGVAGCIFILFHVASALKYYFSYNLAAVYFSFNPLENPIIFGSIAFPILFVMAITSTDWMVQKLKPKRWKFIHRFVYVAYASAIFHFITINPSALKNPAGYLLFSVTVAAVVGMVFWFFKTAAKRKFRSLGTFVGLAIILGTILVGYLVYNAK